MSLKLPPPPFDFAESTRDLHPALSDEQLEELTQALWIILQLQGPTDKKIFIGPE